MIKAFTFSLVVIVLLNKIYCRPQNTPLLLTKHTTTVKNAYINPTTVKKAYELYQSHVKFINPTTAVKISGTFDKKANELYQKWYTDLIAIIKSTYLVKWENVQRRTRRTWRNRRTVSRATKTPTTMAPPPKMMDLNGEKLIISPETSLELRNFIISKCDHIQKQINFILAIILATFVIVIFFVYCSTRQVYGK